MTIRETLSRPDGREARRVLDAELLSELRHFAQTSTEFMARLSGQAINDILDNFTVTLAADNTGLVFVSRQYKVAAGAAYVANLSTGVTAAATSRLGTQPGVAAEIVQTVPAGETWQLQSMDFTLVTSATVANRQVSVVIDDGVNVVWHGMASTVQAATTTVEYTGAAGVAELGAVRNGILAFALPPITLGPGWRIRTVTTALSAGDQYSAPAFAYLRTVAASPVIVAAMGPGGAAPAAGTGVTVVPGGVQRTIALDSRQLTIWGTAGQTVAVVVYAAGPRPVTA